MNKTLENKRIMLTLVLNVLQTEESVWGGSTPVVTAVNDLKALSAKIDQLTQVVSQDWGGQVVNKGNLRTARIESIFELISQLFAMANRSGNEILARKADIPLSEFEGMRDGELADKCHEIVDLARENLSGLVGYPVTEATLNDQEMEIELYKASLPGYKMSVTGRKVANVKLREAYTAAGTLLDKELDRLMVHYKKDHPDFYLAYKSARKIVDYGIRHQPPTDSNPEPPAEAKPAQ